MANKHENLNSLFTNIADAIREKTGGTATIVADDFPDAIRAIPTSEDLSAEITAQDAVIAQIQSALEGKAAGGNTTYNTCQIYFQPSMKLINISATVVNDGTLESFDAEDIIMQEGGLIFIDNVLQGSSICIGLQQGYDDGTIACNGEEYYPSCYNGHFTFQIPTNVEILIFDYLGSGQ